MEPTRPFDGRIAVFCRFRPFSPREQECSGAPAYRQLDKATVEMASLKEGETINYSFDSVFGGQASQAEVYELTTQPIVSKVFSGYNGAVMAYGQTASGKTHTMQGPPDARQPDQGIMPRAMNQLFGLVEASPSHIEVQIRVSVIELYLEKVRDLLDSTPKHLKIRQHQTQGIFIQNLREISVNSQRQFQILLSKGTKSRITSQTYSNQRSSRSHLILIIGIRQQNKQNSTIRAGKLFLVDLAGSEKTDKSRVEGRSMHQANKINSSLSVLGKVIKDLSQGGIHVPYRESKLTRILQQAIGGNSLTSLIVTCSPHKSNIAETLSTLRFGDSTRKIRNKPKPNKQLDVRDLQALLDRITRENDEKTHRIAMLQDMLKGKSPGQHPSLHDSSHHKLKRRLTDFHTPTERSLNSSIVDDCYSEVSDLREDLEQKCRELMHKNALLEDENRQLQLKEDEKPTVRRRATIQNRSCAGRVMTPRFGQGNEENLLDFSDVPFFRSRREQPVEHHSPKPEPQSNPKVELTSSPTTFRLQNIDITIAKPSKPEPSETPTIKKSTPQPNKLIFDGNHVNSSMSFKQCAERFKNRLQQYHKLATQLNQEASKNRQKRLEFIQKWRQRANNRGASVDNV